INYLGKLFAGLLKLPVWLDAIGTVLSSMLGGPIIGAASGIVNNLVYGVTVDPISTVYAITQGAIGLVVGVMAFKGWLSSFKKVIGVGIIVGVIATIVSTPLNLIFWGGQTGKDRKSTRLNSSHVSISYAVFFLKKTISYKQAIFVNQTIK